MGFIARAQLASAVSNAGGFGIIETSSGRLNEVREEMAAMRDLTEKPWGVNIAQMLVSDPHIVDFVADQGVRFVTTSAGDPQRYTQQLHDAGITVFHVVPSLRAAQKAVDAGVDGLVVEGGEGGGFKSTKPVSTMVLVPQICGDIRYPCHRRRRDRRRPFDGCSVRIGSRRDPDGDADGQRRRITGARQLQETGH